MNSIDKYLKATKNVLIKPDRGDIEQKILNRISNISEKDKALLDEKFLEYLKKSNSRLYLLAEEIQNRPGKLIAILIAVAAIAGLVVFIYRNCRKKSQADKR
ncbi:MAG: hypothetical protein FJW66_05120 [Actinobacteria bacterium]|nr:hypothetical protein [Actinomycetota bacterium]